MIQRIDPSLLRHGAVIELDDLVFDQAVEHYKNLYFKYLCTPENAQRSPFIVVDYLVRNGPNNYEIVPISQYDLSELTRYGLLLDTRHVNKVAYYDPKITKPTRVVSTRAIPTLYVEQLTNRPFTMSGTELVSLGLIHKEDIRRVRPHHHYMFLSNLIGLIQRMLLLRHPQSRRFLATPHIVDVVFKSSTVRQFARYVEFKPSVVDIQISGGASAESCRISFLDIDYKRLRSWLKRNQSRFYESAEAYQKVIDDFDHNAAVHELQEQLQERWIRKQEQQLIDNTPQEDPPPTEFEQYMFEPDDLDAASPF